VICLKIGDKTLAMFLEKKQFFDKNRVFMSE